IDVHEQKMILDLVHNNKFNIIKYLNEIKKYRTCNINQYSEKIYECLYWTVLSGEYLIDTYFNDFVIYGSVISIALFFHNIGKINQNIFSNNIRQEIIYQEDDEYQKLNFDIFQTKYLILSENTKI